MSNEPTPALAEQLRAPGWYWVNVAVGEEGDIWVPACWRPSTGTWPDHSAWFLADSSEQMRCDDELLEIGPRIPSPDEAPTDRRGVEADDEQRETWQYLWRWVERGLFDKQVTFSDAFKVMAHHPGAPWNNGVWDVSHKPYAEQFYTKFPKARPLPAPPASGGE